MSNAMILCNNCLEVGAKAVSVGPELGNQRDPWRMEVYLCDPCAEALESADFSQLAARWTSERTVAQEARS